MVECEFCDEEPGVGEPGEEWISLQQCSKCGRNYCNCCRYTVYAGKTWLSYCPECGPDVDSDVHGH